MMALISLATLVADIVVVPEIHARNGAHGAQRGNGPGEPVRRNAHSHAALHDRQKFTALEAPARQVGVECGSARSRLAGDRGRHVDRAIIGNPRLPLL